MVISSKRSVRHFVILGVAAVALLGMFLVRGTSEPIPVEPSVASIQETPSLQAAPVPEPARIEAVAAPAPAPVREAEGTPTQSAAIAVPQQDETPVSTASVERAVKLAPHGRRPDRGNLPLNRNHPQVKRAIEVQERNLDLMNQEAVVGTAVSLNDKGEVVIAVYTKLGGADIPDSLEGIEVESRPAGEFVARGTATLQLAPQVAPQAGETGNAQRWERPVPIGVSTGHPSITAGTIGCRVTDGSNVYALSNNHVYAASNQAAISDPVIQPGTYDGGSYPADGIGSLAAYKEIVFGGNPKKPQNEMDAAIALSTTDDLGNSTPHTGGYGTPSSTTVLPALGMGVRKVGRTTGDTTGTVDALNAVVTVTYGGGRAYFKNQVVIVPGTFSAGGDSGSLIVTDDANNNPVALLFAGSTSHTIGSEIDPILAYFGVTVDDSDPGPANATPQVVISAPADGSEVESGASVDFAGTAGDDEDGDLTAALAWTSSIDGVIGAGGSFTAALSDGSHVITASATDSGGKAGSAAVSIQVGTPTTPTDVSVSSVAYATEGGKGGTRNLLITVSLADNLGDPVSGAAVSIQVDNTTTGAGATGTGTTGSSGSVTFTWRNAASGHYTTTVTNVSASGLTWDGATPDNGFDK